MDKVWNWLEKEFREILPVWVFFFVAFGLLALTLAAVIDEYHVDMYQPPEYLIGSLIMAKAVLLVDSFFSREWIRDRALIYATLWNTALYSVGALIVHHFEELLKFMWRQHLTFAQANRQIFREMEQHRFWAIVAWLIAVTFTFCTIRELIGVIGGDRFMEMFFRRRPPRDLRKAS